jgi:hypothetical protein
VSNYGQHFDLQGESMRILLALLCLAASSLSAATFTVANVSDSGTGSLRDAITQANALAGDDIINFGPGVTGTITLSSTLPQITQAGGVLTINGPGRSLLTISGNGNVQILDTGLAAWLNLNRLTLTSGRAAVTGSDASGGAIYSRGTLVIYDVEITNCSAVCPASTTGNGGSAYGGAIFHQPVIANLSITNSRIAGCLTQGGATSFAGATAGSSNGGAICALAGSLLLTQVTIENCQANGGTGTGTNCNGGAARGGAIYADVVSSLVDCVLTNNDSAGGNGSGTGTNAAASGGGIYGGNSLTLNRSTIEQCDAFGGISGTGGGVAIVGGPAAPPTVDIQDTLIDTCTCASSGTGSASFGGGLFSEFETTVAHTQVTGCSATSGNNAQGGGAYFASSGANTVTTSTFDTNVNGGVVAAAGTITFTNCTFSGNTGAAGSGIACTGAIVTVTYSTVTANASTSAYAGGVFNSGGTITLVGCIVAANTSTTGGPDIGGTAANGGNNLIGVQDAAMAFVNNANGCKVGSVGTPLVPLLGPLTNNGGKTPTHALLAGSPAINAGGTAGVPSTDQRDAPRDQGVADMGSYEFGATPPNTGGQAGGEGDGRCSASESANWFWALLVLALAGTMALRRRTA